MTKYKLEYIWLDGYEPVPNLRSKTKIVEFAGSPTLEELPVWNFDGSSTRQAEGSSSDCLLQPVALFRNPGFQVFRNDIAQTVPRGGIGKFPLALPVSQQSARIVRLCVLDPFPPASGFRPFVVVPSHLCKSLHGVQILRLPFQDILVSGSCFLELPQALKRLCPFQLTFRGTASGKQHSARDENQDLPPDHLCGVTMMHTCLVNGSNLLPLHQ